MTSDSISLKSYLAKRLIQIIPLFFIIISLNFMIIHLAPGDPITLLAGEYMTSPEYIAMMRQRFGLDRPVHEQLFIYISRILSGDLGYSFVYEQPVLKLILERIPNTLELMGTQIILASIIGIIFGVKAARKPNSFTDNLITFLSTIGYSMPVFWLAQILMLIFSLQLRWFPISGMTSVELDLSGIAKIIDILRHMFLPSLCLVMWQLPLITRLTRASMMDTLKKDFIVMARSKGVSERDVLYKHALRNALLPIITVIGMNLGSMLAGAILTETVFSWPGLGRLMYDAIFQRDYPLIMGMFVFVSIMVIMANLIIDILYSFIDPRIRYK